MKTKPENITDKRKGHASENEVNFARKVTVAESRGTRENLTLLFIEREDIMPLLGMDWLREFNWTIRIVESTTKTRDQSEKYKISKNFEKRLNGNRTKKDTKIKVKPGHIPIKQKTLSMPYHLPSYVEKKLTFLIQLEPWEKVKFIESCLASQVVITGKKDKAAKIELESRKKDDSCKKGRLHMLKMEELLTQLNAKIIRVQSDPLWMSKKDFNYRYVQSKFSEDTSRLCNFATNGGNVNGPYRFKEGLKGSSNIPTLF